MMMMMVISNKIILNHRLFYYFTNSSSYPTIMLAPAGDKSNPIPYSGERDVKSFTAFLQKNAKKMTPKKQKQDL
jgi:hypothetical protein